MVEVQAGTEQFGAFAFLTESYRFRRTEPPLAEHLGQRPDRPGCAITYGMCRAIRENRQVPRAKQNRLPPVDGDITVVPQYVVDHGAFVVITLHAPWAAHVPLAVEDPHQP